MDTEEVVHVHSGIVATEKNETVPIAAQQMSQEIIILCEVTQKEKDKYPMTSFIGLSKNR